MKLRYLDFTSALGESASIADAAAMIGRVTAGAGLTLRAFATLRADGEHIRVGHNAYFGEHATAHIVDAKIGTTVGDDVMVGRYGVVHGCTLGNCIVIGEGSVANVLDELERSLVEIVHSPAQVSAADLEQLRRRIDAAALLFKIRVLHDELREREAAPAQPRKTT